MANKLTQVFMFGLITSLVTLGLSVIVGIITSILNGSFFSNFLVLNVISFGIAAIITNKYIYKNKLPINKTVDVFFFGMTIPLVATLIGLIFIMYYGINVFLNLPILPLLILPFVYNGIISLAIISLTNRGFKTKNIFLISLIMVIISTLFVVLTTDVLNTFSVVKI